MADIQSDKFLKAYGNFLVKAWGMPPLKNRFKKEPEKVLREFGLDPEGAKVIVEPPGPPSPQATAESAVKLWNEGKKAGRIRFVFPEEPPADLKTEILTDKQLEAIAGGMASSDGGCTTCCPCCCCT